MGSTPPGASLKVLAIDTTSPLGSVALTDGDCLIGEYLLSADKTHSAILLSIIDRLLSDAAAAVEQIDLVAVSSGPGSFTGLRVGISTAQGLAFSHEKPLVAVPTLEVIASQAPGYGRFICPMIDSRRQEVYTSLFSYDQQGVLHQLMMETVIKPEHWLLKIKEPAVFLGSGATLYAERIKAALGDQAVILPVLSGVPRAASVAALALRRFLENKQNDLDTISPVYIRPPEAEIKTGESQGSFLPLGSKS